MTRRPAPSDLSGQLAAAVAEAARLERRVEHLREVVGHPDELQAAFNRLERLRFRIARLTAGRRAAERGRAEAAELEVA